MKSTIVQFGLTLSGDVSSFEVQRDAIAAAVATATRCIAPDCSLQLRVAAAGSVNIDTFMAIPDGNVNSATIVAEVESATSTLLASGPTQISNALGVTVVAVSPASTVIGASVVLVVAPPPPSPPPPFIPPSSPPEAVDTIVIVGAAAGGLAAVLCLGLVLWQCRSGSRNTIKNVEQGSVSI